MPPSTELRCCASASRSSTWAPACDSAVSSRVLPEPVVPQITRNSSAATRLGMARGSGGTGVSITNQALTYGAIGTASLTYRLDSSGVVKRGRGGAYTTLETWLLSGAASGYDAYVTVTVGALDAGTTGAWVNLGTTRDWTLTAYNSGDSLLCTFTVQIRNASSLVVLDTATIELNSISF